MSQRAQQVIRPITNLITPSSSNQAMEGRFFQEMSGEKLNTVYQNDVFSDADIPDYLRSVAAAMTPAQSAYYNANSGYQALVSDAIKKMNDQRAAARTDFEASQAGSALQKTPIGTGGPQTTVDKATAPVIGQQQLSSLLGDDERNLLGL